MSVSLTGHANCEDKNGVDQLRCLRHIDMAEKCGEIQGEAHYVCDAGFLKANPLKCDKQTGDELKRCNKEVTAFKQCKKKSGRVFLECVKTKSGERPT
jgi:hypothetical protein